MNRVTVYLGADGLQRASYAGASENFRTVSGWSTGAGIDFDYGAILLPQPAGQSLGWFGVEESTNDELTTSPIVISGYPVDKPPRTQWWVRGAVASTTPTRVQYALFTADGDSGCPVIRTESGGPYVVAVHAYGNDGGLNFGVRVTAAMHQRIREWTA